MFFLFSLSLLFRFSDCLLFLIGQLQFLYLWLEVDSLVCQLILFFLLLLLYFFHFLCNFFSFTILLSNFLFFFFEHVAFSLSNFICFFGILFNLVNFFYFLVFRIFRVKAVTDFWLSRFVFTVFSLLFLLLFDNINVLFSQIDSDLHCFNFCFLLDCLDFFFNFELLLGAL